MNIEDKFREYCDTDFLKFELIENKRTQRPDLHAFLLLDELFPGKRCIIDSAEHDEIYLNIDSDDIEKLSDKQILELVRCGVRCGEYSLCMFV